MSGRPAAIGFGFGLAMAAAAAMADGAAWSVERHDLAPGVVHEIWRAGPAAAAADARWQVVVGPAAEPAAADQAMAEVEAAGFAPAAVYTPAGYEIRLLELENDEAARAAVDRLAAAGLGAGARILRVTEPDLTATDGPFVAHVLRVGPESCSVFVARSDDAAFGTETTRSLARRQGALAAVNGGYFVVRGPLAGESEGVLVAEGRMVSNPERARGAIGWFEDAQSGRRRAVVGPLDWRGALVRRAGGRVALTGINQARGEAAAVLYTAEFHRTTLTDPGGLELIVRGDRVAERREGRGSAAIPADGFVVSLGPRAPDAELVRGWRVGDEVALDLSLVPLGADPEAGAVWRRASSVVGGGPVLLRTGRPVADLAAEKVARVFFAARHPRTAAGVTAEGVLLLVAVDGRRPGHSAGMSLPELSDLMLRLGAVDAVNLDGGGSTAMVVRDSTVNRPSDPAGERENGDAVLVRCEGAPAAGRRGGA